MVIKVRDETKLGEVLNRVKGNAATQRDLDGPEEWANGNFVKFSKVIFFF